MQTQHAKVRSQQRGIPPFIDQLLDQYGNEQYDGHGGIILYMDKISIRKMERDMGREPVRLLAQWKDVYKVKSSADGSTITIGHRVNRIRRV
jgi:hypothetical protein